MQLHIFNLPNLERVYGITDNPITYSFPDSYVYQRIQVLYCDCIPEDTRTVLRLYGGSIPADMIQVLYCDCIAAV